MENKISVIVCTYNQESTIGRTLDSILSQNCHIPVEIIIGEDCSTDGTLSVCLDYEKRFPDRIRVIANKENKGVVDNYFDCIMLADGKYIADCAGDDYWMDNRKLEKELRLLESNADVTIVHTDWQRLLERNGHIVPSPKRVREYDIIEGSELLEDILSQTSRPAIHLCTSLYRTEPIRQAHDTYRKFFRNPQYPCEDIQVAFFLARMGKVAYIDDVTLNYSESESVSQSGDSERLFRFFRQAGQLNYDLAVEFDLLTPRVRSFLRRRIFGLLMHALRCKSKELREEAMQLTDTWNTGKDIRISTVIAITSNPLTWSAATAVRKIVTTVKTLLED